MPRKQTILVIEDSENVAKTLAPLLQYSGYNASAVYSGSEALESLDGLPLDLAMIDVNLPGIDGVQTAIEICKRRPTCKVLLMSGNPESTHILERAEAEGIVFPVLAKPIPIQELLSTVASLLQTAQKAKIKKAT
jgi:DNA-binding response OmpR family regulator